MARVLKCSGLVLAACLLAGCASRYYYDPDRIVHSTPLAKHEDLVFPSWDGTKLHAWFLRAQGTPKGTVIHFHGRDKNITAHAFNVAWLPEEGFNVFLFEYRGFGKSEGKPTQRAVHRDSMAAVNYVLSRKDVDTDRLLVFGQSLGGAIAIAVTGEMRRPEIKAVVAEAPFCSYRRLVRNQIEKMDCWSILRGPISLLVTNNRYSPIKYIDEIAPTPLLLIHGTADIGITIDHSEFLFKRAKKPKEMWVVQGGRHLDTFTKHKAMYRKRLVEFFRLALEKESGEKH